MAVRFLCSQAKAVHSFQVRSNAQFLQCSTPLLLCLGKLSCRYAVLCSKVRRIVCRTSRTSESFRLHTHRPWPLACFMCGMC